MEHVEDPFKASKEIVRVLKRDGILYSELPFLQSIHEKEFDFTRFTLNGHLKLFSSLRIREKGISKGFYIVVLWMLRDQLKIISQFYLSYSLLFFIHYSMFWIAF